MLRFEERVRIKGYSSRDRVSGMRSRREWPEGEGIEKFADEATDAGIGEAEDGGDRGNENGSGVDEIKETT